MLPTLLILVAVPTWSVENPNADVAIDTVDGQGVVHVSDPGHPAISLRTDFEAEPYRGKQIKVIARVQADGNTGAAYAVVSSEQKTLVFHEKTRETVAGWTTVTVVADVPADATHVVLGLYQQANKATFGSVSVEESRGDITSAHAEFVLRPNRATGSNVARESWMRTDDSRVVADGGAVSFLAAALVDVKSLTALQQRSYSRRY